MVERIWLLLAAVGLLVTATIWGARAEPREPRVALVIGNAAYRHAGGLRNPINDAEAISAAVQALGFEVIKVTNADRSQMVRAMGDFAKRLKADGVGLFFYAGHGIQTAGNNYLIPVDADIQEEYDTSFLGINVNDVLRVMEGAGTRFNMLILDACRDNPFERRYRSAGSRGLAPIEAPRGALIAYATAPGKTAADGDGTNGLFTAEFLKAMARPNLTIDEVLKETGGAVEKASANKQVPWINSSYRGRFYLHAEAAAAAPAATASAPAPAAPVATPEAMELAAWNAVATSTSANVLQAFLREFPDGRFAGLARAKLEEAEKPVTRQAAPTPAAAPAAAPAPVATDKRKRYVARTSIKVRAAPSLEAAVVGGLAPGDAVAAKSSDEGWVEIAFGEASGFVAAGLLRLASDEEPVSGAARPAKIEPPAGAPPKARAVSPAPPPLRGPAVVETAAADPAAKDGGWMKDPRPLPPLVIRSEDGRPVGHLDAGEGAVRVVLDRPPHADRYGGARQVVQWSHVFRRDDQLWIKGVRKLSQDKYPLVSLRMRLPSDAPMAGLMTLAADQEASVPVQLGAARAP